MFNTHFAVKRYVSAAHQATNDDLRRHDFGRDLGVLALNRLEIEPSVALGHDERLDKQADRPA